MGVLDYLLYSMLSDKGKSYLKQKELEKQTKLLQQIKDQEEDE